MQADPGRTATPGKGGHRWWLPGSNTLTMSHVIANSTHISSPYPSSPLGKANEQDHGPRGSRIKPSMVSGPLSPLGLLSTGSKALLSVPAST